MTELWPLNRVTTFIYENVTNRESSHKTIQYLIFFYMQVKLVRTRRCYGSCKSPSMFFQFRIFVWPPFQWNVCEFSMTPSRLLLIQSNSINYAYGNPAVNYNIIRGRVLFPILYGFPEKIVERTLVQAHLFHEFFGL